MAALLSAALAGSSAWQLLQVCHVHAAASFTAQEWSRTGPRTHPLWYPTCYWPAGRIESMTLYNVIQLILHRDGNRPEVLSNLNYPVVLHIHNKGHHAAI